MVMEIYTDGSCIGNPGPGGWGVISTCGVEISGASSGTTNNIMEMTAVNEALLYCVSNRIQKVKLYTDSNYVKQGITNWIHKWKLNNWKTSSGSDVKNKQLWSVMDNLKSRVDVEWCWVRAHNGNKYNEMVDKLALTCARNISQPQV